MSAFSKLKKTAQKSDKKKTNAIEITNKQLDPACDDVIRYSQQKKDADAGHKKSQQPILDHVRDVHAKTIADGEPGKTFKVNDKLLCIFTDKFSPVSDIDKEELSSALTEKQMNSLFQETATLKIKDNVATNEEKLTELMELLGDDLDKFFEVKVETYPVSDFDKKVAYEGCYEDIRSVVERIRSKPTIRIA